LKIVSFGDEHTIDTQIPHYLAARLGLELENHGKEDISNQKIFTDVCKYVCENKTDDLILIGWTNAKRMDVEYDTYFTYRPDKTDYPVNKINELHQSDAYLFNEKVIHGEWAAIACSLQETLKNMKRRFYMYNTQDYIKYNEKTARTVRLLDARYYHNPMNLDSSFTYWADKHNFKGEQAHKSWARFLHNKINAVELL